MNETESWLSDARLVDTVRATANLRRIEASGLPAGVVQVLVQLLKRHLPSLSDPDMALNSLERLVASPVSARILTAAISTDPSIVGKLLVLFSASQYVSDVLVRDADSLEAMIHQQGRLFSSGLLRSSLARQMEQAGDRARAMEILRQFKHQQFLRIIWADLIDGCRIQRLTQQISWVAIAICEAACQWARAELETRFGVPRNRDGQRCGYCILAMGKLGGSELNYSSDIDLMMIYEQDGQTDSRSPKSNRQFFTQLTRDIVRLIHDPTNSGSAWRVDLRLRPHGSRGAICNSVAATLHYYDFQGRTWERLALIKAHPIAGDLELGHDLLHRIKTWIYRVSVSRHDIRGIQLLKRRIENRTVDEGEQNTNVKTGRGGIRDIEFVIQFMQLLNGHAIPKLRTGNTLVAIGRLERAGCLTMSESSRLRTNYVWLRKLEHRLQILSDQQTHTLPEHDDELTRTAVRMGYSPQDRKTALSHFRRDLASVTEINRKILDHLLHGAFGPHHFIGQEDQQPDVDLPIEVELILEPEPSQEMIEAALTPYGFQNLDAAWRILNELSIEKTRFLSPRRCKHFFASIAQSLLVEVSQTPDPDATLVGLSSISDSLGARGVLWELFRLNPPTLALYVRMCAVGEYLASIFRSNPGMIDELMDALQRQGLPNRQRLGDEIHELTRAAEDVHLIVLSFKNAYHLRVGIRDILDRDEIRQRHRALSDIADCCLEQIAESEYRCLAQRWLNEGVVAPPLSEIPFAIVALGKLGGREPNYHSDLDVIFLYEREETFEAQIREGRGSQFFFSELAGNITRAVSRSTPAGRLYEIDSRLRPTGKSGSLATSTEEFLRYFREGKGQLWERQSLCKARVIVGGRELRDRVDTLIREAIVCQPWDSSMGGEIHQMRLTLQRDASDRNIKRGIGGAMDIEFIVQALQLQHLHGDDGVRVPGTLEAIDALVEGGYLDSERGDQLGDAYQTIRRVESGLRLMNATARHDLPDDQRQLTKLAFLLRYDDASHLERTLSDCRSEVRRWFEEMVPLTHSV